MNIRSLKQTQKILDTMISTLFQAQISGLHPGTATLNIWYLELDKARSELLEFESSLLPAFNHDMNGVAYGTTGE